MKLIRFGDSGYERPGVLTDEGLYLDVSNFCDDYDDSFFANNGIQELKRWFSQKRHFLPLVPEEVRFGTPLAKPSKIICLKQKNQDVAKSLFCENPEFFLKPPAAIVGADDHILISDEGEKVNYNFELGVVIGRSARDVNEDNAMTYVAGYCIHNNYSEEPSEENKDAGSSISSLGPYLATPDEISNVNNLYLWLKVNGRLVKKGNTSNMTYSVPFLVSYLSQRVTLLPGDIISLGFFNDQQHSAKSALNLNSGDIVESSIEGLGVAKHHISTSNKRENQERTSYAFDSSVSMVAAV